MLPIPTQDWFQSLQTCRWFPERRNYPSTWECSWRLRLVPWLALSPHAGLQRRKARRLRIEIQEQVFLAAQDLLLQTRRPQKGRVSDERSCIAHLPPQNLGVLGPALLPQHSQSEQGQQKTVDARRNSGRVSDVLSSKNIHCNFVLKKCRKVRLNIGWVQTCTVCCIKTASPDAIAAMKQFSEALLCSRREHQGQGFCAVGVVKCLPMSELAEREGFEPSVQVLARTTV